MRLYQTGWRQDLDHHSLGNDLLLFASDDKLMAKMKADIKAVWEATDIGESSKIVGMEITINDDSVCISQQKYIENILVRQEHMLNANPVGTPLDHNIQLQPNPDGNKGDRKNSYARLLGELQWVANATRPDIAYAVNKLAAYTLPCWDQESWHYVLKESLFIR
jgi:hypothetical protein